MNGIVLKRLFISLTLALATPFVVGSAVVSAHSGASGVRVQQQAVFTIRPDAIAIEYISQLNRAGAYLESLRMDANGDGELSSAEQAAYFDRQEKALVGGLEVSVDGRELTLRPLEPVELSMPTPMLFQKLYRFEIPHGDNWEQGAVVEFHNDNYLDFSGPVTVTIDPGDAADVVYDSRWAGSSNGQLDAAGERQERDLVFRYRRGTGKSDPPEGFFSTTNGAHDEPVARAAAEPGFDRPTWKAFLPSVGAILLGAALLALIRAGGRLSRSSQRSEHTIGHGVSVRVRLLGAAMIATTVASASILAWSPFRDATRPASTVVVPDDLLAGQIFQRLHGKIYEAFDAQTESDIYDTLAQALEGRVLEDVYHEVHAALLARTRGATRFSVRRVKPIATEVLPGERSDRPGFRVRYRWRVYGTVTHFSHTHARFNEYEAVYLIQHNGRAWRITDSQVRQNKRVSIGRS